MLLGNPFCQLVPVDVVEEFTTGEKFELVPVECLAPTILLLYRKVFHPEDVSMGFHHAPSDLQYLGGVPRNIRSASGAAIIIIIIIKFLVTASLLLFKNSETKQRALSYRLSSSRRDEIINNNSLWIWVDLDCRRYIRIDLDWLYCSLRRRTDFFGRIMSIMIGSFHLT